MTGNVLIAYIDMAKGSPCVVPSCERMTSPLIKREVLPAHIDENRSQCWAEDPNVS